MQSYINQILSYLPPQLQEGSIATYVAFGIAGLLFLKWLFEPAARMRQSTLMKPTLKPNEFQKVDPVKEMEKDCPSTGKGYAVIGVGFVGRCIVEYLLERGDGSKSKPIVCIDMMPKSPIEADPFWRHGSNNKFGKRMTEDELARVTYVQGNVTSIDSLVSALKDKNIEVVFMTAAFISFYERLAFQADLSYQINVVGAQNVCKAMIKCGIPNLIFTSTSHVALNKDDKERVLLTEEHPYTTRQNSFNHYAWSKAEAEQEVLKLNGTPLEGGKKSKDDVLKVVVCRPCSGVFGYNDKLMCQELAKNGQYCVSDNDGKCLNNIYVNNVVFGELLAERALLDNKPGVVGQAFNLVSNPICPTEQIYRLMHEYWPAGKQQAEKDLPIGFLPKRIMKGVAYWLEFLQWITGRGINKYLQSAVMLTPPMIAITQVTYSYSDKKAKSLIAYRDLFTFQEACQRVAWQYYTEKQQEKEEGKKNK